MMSHKFLAVITGPPPLNLPISLENGEEINLKRLMREQVAEVEG